MEARLASWDASIPGAFVGTDLEQDLMQEQWSGRLTKTSCRKVQSIYESEHLHQFVLFRGTEGLGKSTLAAAVTRRLIEGWNASALYVSAPALLNDLSFSGNENWIRRCIDPDILLLDDIGASVETQTDHQRKCMWAIINGRYGVGKCTIITSNMAVAAGAGGIGLKDWFGESGWARISEDLVHVEFSGESFRSSPA